MSPPIANLSALLSELKRRRVFRVAAVYAAVAFIIIQIIDGAFDYLPIPDWVGTAIIVVLLVGFPIAVGLAWAFDITERGVVRTAATGKRPKKRLRCLLKYFTDPINTTGSYARPKRMRCLETGTPCFVNWLSWFPNLEQ